MAISSGPWRSKKRRRLLVTDSCPIMNAIKSQLHKTVFVPDNEKLHAVVRIIAIDKKKKERFLCIVATMDQPVTVRLYFIKSEKDNKLRKKESYYLRDIRTIDGINPRKTIADFRISVHDQEFLLTADNFEAKDDFIREMYKLSSRYLPVQRPDFANVPFANVPLNEPTFSSTFEAASDDDMNDHIIDYQPISSKEEADFRRLLAKSELKIGEAEKFAKVLNEQLTQLDGANIESIMDNEQAVTDLINLIDNALDEATNLESQLDNFDDILSFVRDSVELIEEKDSLGTVERNNTMKLLDELQSFINAVDLVNEEHISVLERPNLSDPSSISRCCVAARAINNFLNTKTSLSLMDAYKTQMDRLSGITDAFIDTLMAHLSGLFYRLNEMLEGQDWHELSLPKQSQRFHALNPFADLISWLKQSKPSVYQKVIQRYIEETRKLYARNMKRFFDVLEPHLERIAALDRKSAAKAPDNIGRGAAGRTSGRVDWSDDGNSEYLRLMETVLGELAPVVDSEQKFCTRFFHINSDILANIETQSTGSGDSGGALTGGRNLEKHLNEKVRDVMTPLFGTLEGHLQSFVKACCSKRATVVFPLFVMLSKRARANQDASSFFSVMILGRLVVLTKRELDMLMEREGHFLQGSKLTKRVRVGILDTIERFEELARCAEKAFAEGSERRNELDRWYGELVNHVVRGIEAAALSSYSKSPASVVRLENYHTLYLTLSELKIECLDARRKDAKKQYQDNMQVYVKEYMGRPLEKIHLFFEQVQAAIDSGIKPDEISYQSSFTRDELRRVISSYPGKEVKKGLEMLYKKVEKHLVDQSPLLQVVWRYMQDEFLKQLKNYKQVIGQCYPNQRVDLEVSINEVLQFFSEIAQQH
uniref:Sec3-PIP2_bind domain-containing protein n=1 Tax=Steinernema glaseri TaxID=37863 RepID=A0A1I7YSD8_9BILA